MMKQIATKWNLFSTIRRLSHSSSSSSSSSPRDSLFLRISSARDPTIPMASILNQWIQEGRYINQTQLHHLIKQLRSYRRFGHALQISEWISNETKVHLLSRDYAVHLDLIAKVRGLDQAEKYFNTIPHISRDFKVYGILLNCYAQHNKVDKAEAIMNKLKVYAFKSNHEVDFVLSYNALLKLYTRTGQNEKSVALIQEMKDKKMYNSRTLTLWLHAYVTTNDIDEMENLLAHMEVDLMETSEWFVYSVAADGYIKAGQFEKALTMLMKSEQLINGLSKRGAYESLLVKHASIGNKDAVYRIWNLCKTKLNGYHNSTYVSMLTALSKLDDIDGAERILEEWESGTTRFDIRIPNLMVSAYCKNGLLEKAEAYVARLLKMRDNKLGGRTWDRLARGYYKCNDMDKAIGTMKKAILADGEPGWKPYPFTFAACLEHLKEKGDLELALEILGTCRERGHFSAATCDTLLSYVHGEISETNVLNLMKGEYKMKTDALLDRKQGHDM